MGDLLSYVASLAARAASVEGQRQRAEAEAAELAQLRSARDRHVAQQLARLPLEAVEAARRYARRSHEGERSEALRWALALPAVPAWQDGRSAILCGPKGAGKTTALCALAGLEARDRGAVVRYVRAIEYGPWDRRPELREPFEVADLVIVDQTHRLAQVGEWARAQVAELVDLRYAESRRTVLCGTMPLATLAALLGDDTIDRCPPALRLEVSSLVESRRWT